MIGCLKRATDGQISQLLAKETMMELSIYPTIWGEGEDALAYLLDGFGTLRAFVQATAEQGSGLVVWLS